MSAAARERTPVLDLVLAVSAALVVFGLRALHGSAIGASVPGAVRGVVSQLPRTLPAAVLVLAVTAADVMAGAVVVRAVRGKPYRCRLDAILFGLAGAVLVDTLVLCVVGAAGLFVAPVILAVHVLIVAACWTRCRPFFTADPHEPHSVLTPGFLVFVAVAWSGPLILQLASPVVPFRDLLQNHVAPVEFVRTFHAYTHLFTSPAAETGPSRHELGYVGLLSTVSSASARTTALAVAAFAFPLTLLFGVAAYRFAETRLAPGIGRWALVTMPLTFAFLRLPDARGTVLVVPLLLASFLPMRELDARRRVLVRALILAAAIYVHPLLGLLTLATHGAAAVWLGSESGDDEDFPLGAVAGALAFAFPELLLMAGRDAPSWIVLTAIPLGWAVCALRVRVPPRRIAAAVVLAALGAVLLAGTVTGPRVLPAIANAATIYPLTTVGFAAFVVTRVSRSARPLLLSAVTVGVVAYVAATFLPNTVFWNGSRNEVTGKVSYYWWPLFLAFGAAGALWWAWERRGDVTGRVLVAVFCAASVLPLRQGTVGIDDYPEHRVSESLSIALHKAEFGGWEGWPDARNVVDGAQRELLATYRREQRAGRITRDTRTLHVAVTRWTWDSTPVAVFTGTYETNFSEAPDVSGHTHGGRLYRYADLPRFLGSYPYVLLEPVHIPPQIRDEIVAAGYETIFRNDRGEIFRKG